MAVFRWRKRKSDFDTALRAFALEVSGAASVPEATDLVLETLTRSLPGPAFALFLLDRSRRTFHLAAARGIDETSLSRLVIARDGSLGVLLSLRRSPLELRGYHDPVLSDSDRAVLAASRARLVIPLFGKTRFIGMLFVGSPAGRKPFTAAESGFLADLAGLAGGALEYVFLFGRLCETHRHFGAVLGHLNRGVFILDADRRVQVWNHAMEKITGLASSGAMERDAGRLFAEMGVPSVSTAVAEVLKENQAKFIEGVRWRNEGGGAAFRVRLRPISEGEGEPRGLLGMVLDETERVQLEARVQRTEKLASVGKIASTLAHEIRNPLNAMKGAIAFLQTKFSNDVLLLEFTEIINEEITRLNTFVTNFLARARKAEPRFVPLDVNEEIRRTLDFVGQQARPDCVAVTEDLGPLPSVVADPGQLRQVFTNLARNAVEAMPVGGSLTVRTSIASAAEAWPGAPARRAGDGRTGREAIRIEFQDTGSGIAEEIRGHLFEPFNSSKEKGTGLGLFISREIVEGHGGRLAVTSAPGHGTTITVYLPVDGSHVPADIHHPAR
ncbi:MAG: hypothetical protein A2V83_08015 [Nitrospirae bacterium RBG_16_64_22]|nr:MAG: hypothetical protein A2V83_08015 [Nitrospirae bacterium RBG_16_64_22]